MPPNEEAGLTRLDAFLSAYNPLSGSFPPRCVDFCPSGSPPQSDASMECVSIHQSCLTLATPPCWKTARERHGGSQISATRFPARTPTREHIRQGAGLVDEKKFTNCLIIQIFMIMNRYSTVREHGAQPELPPQHSSCES